MMRMMIVLMLLRSQQSHRRGQETCQLVVLVVALIIGNDGLLAKVVIGVGRRSGAVRVRLRHPPDDQQRVRLASCVVP